MVEAIIESAVTWPIPCHLCLADNEKVGTEGAKVLARAINEHPRLFSSLDLSFTEIGKKGVRALINANASNIKITFAPNDSGYSMVKKKKEVSSICSISYR